MQLVIMDQKKKKNLARTKMFSLSTARMKVRLTGIVCLSNKVI